MDHSASLIPDNENERIQALRRFEILDTPPDGAFDAIAALAARIFNVPIAIISLVDTDRIWFKSHHGIESDEVPRDPGLCASAILQDDVYVIPDARKNVLALANPLVAGDLGLRFYAAAPLTTDDGYNLGTLCVCDRKPRQVGREELETLRSLARLVMAQIETRLQARRTVAGLEGQYRLSRQRFIDLAEALPGLVWVVESDGSFEYANSKFYEYTGLSKADVRERGPIAAICPEDRERWSAGWDAAASSRQVFSGEFRLLHGASGAYRWHVVNAKPTSLGSGFFVWNVSAWEIHEHREVEEALRENESRLRAILESEPECVKIVSPDGTLVEMNPAGLRMIEADTRGEAIGRAIRDVIHPDDRHRFLKLHSQVLSGGAGRLEFRIFGLKGTERWMETHSVPLRRADGSVGAVLSVTRDISERKRDERWRDLETQVLELVSTGAPLLQVLDRLTRAVDEIVPGVVSSISLVEDRRLRTGASPHLPEDYVSATDGVVIGPNAGSCAAAAYLRREVITTNIQADPVWQDYHELARNFGLRACWSVPVMNSRGEVVAALGWYLREPRAPNDQHRKLMRRVSYVAGIAIERLRQIEALGASRALLDMASRISRVGGWEIRLPGAEIALTDESRAILEAPSDYVPTLEGWIGFFAPQSQDVIRAALDASFADGVPFDIELELVTAKGRPVWVRAMGEAVCDSAGEFRKVQGAIQDITDRKRAEEELRLQRWLLASAGEIARVGGWAVEMPSHRVYASDTVYDILQLPRGAPLSLEQGLGYYRPDSLVRVRGALARCLERGEPFDIEAEMLNAAGDHIVVRVLGQAEPKPDGTVRRAYGAIQDITNQKRAEAIRLEAESRFRQLADNIDEVFWLTDPDWRQVLYVSPAYERVWGRSCEALYRNPGEWMESIHPDDRIRVAEPFGRQTSGEHATEYRIIRPGGSERWILHRTFPIRSESGEVYRIAGIAEDITARRRTMAALRESEERFRLIANNTADVVWDWDLIQNRVWWNEGLFKVFGYTPEAMAAGPESWTEHIYPEDRNRVVDGIYAVIRGLEHSWADEYRYQRADGEYALVQDRGFVIRNESGSAIRMVGSMVDVTEQRKRDEQIRQAQRLEAVGKLTGGVAHDFNNLLTVILGNSELLVNCLKDEPRMRGLAEITMNAAEKGAELTGRLLAFARRQALDPEVIDINRLVSGMDGLLRRTLGEHIDIELVRGGGLWNALADRSQLENAILNLCINARDAMPDGGRLTIETANAHLDANYALAHPEVSAGQYVMIAVSDTGVGMSPEVQARAFEPFFTTKPVGQGSGLGLSMVYGFVKQSRGHIKIYSELGQGTTIKLYLPRVQAEKEHRPMKRAPERLAKGAERILVVEDDDLVREYVADQLDSLGYHVVTAVNGPDALELLKSGEEFDLLFTDIVIPGGMSGRVLADEAKKLRPNLPILFTSGYTENAIIHHGRLDPGVHLLHKPYRREDLAAKIRLVLDQGSISRA
ncbi:MAG: PAS domain-containing protein [Bryobacteraceae bacterium]